jgi:uncharacterized lipoprotein YajG
MKLKGGILILVIAGLLLAACGAQAEAPEVTDPADIRSEREVTWDEAIEFLNSRHVVAIAQSHSLDVELTLDDGTNIRTTELRIDDIFDEVTKCGDPCATITLATE